ncbi:hypothetical protein PV325_000328 [Microctonus aethiopoides]|nr:hypothetical protein PV325_000328 [Microctonus aethiopoides]
MGNLAEIESAGRHTVERTAEGLNGGTEKRMENGLEAGGAVPPNSTTRQSNGDTSHNHNGYPTPATSGAHNALNPMNNLNGINAQATYDAK